MNRRTASNPSTRVSTPRANALAATMLLSLVSFVSPPGATAGETPLVVSGTVEYTGSQGPISAQNPILLFLVSNPTLDEPAVDTAMVVTNGGSFELTASQPGVHYLVYLVDTNGDAIPAVGDPYQLYDGILEPPQTGLALSFDDTNELPGVRGTVTYTGSMGPVDADHPIRVDVYRNGDLTDRLLQRQVLTGNGDTYQFFLLDNPSRFFFLRAYLDLNDNDGLDDGEPFTIYNNRTGVPGDPLPQGVADVDISFGDPAQPTPTPVEGAVVSGTIAYTGARGPVSASRPIVMVLSASPNLDGAPVAFAAVETNGGAFELQAPAPGDYYLAYLLDTNGNGIPEIGDPFEVYLDHTSVPGDPVTVPQSDLALSFDDSGGIPGVEGTVTYTGGQGPVSNEKPIIVEAFRDADLTDRLDQPNRLVNNGDPYALILLESHEHYLRAFLDLNNNGSLDPSEPLTIYDGRTAPPGDPVPQDGSMVDLSFGDLPGVATPTPTPKPTPPAIACVGDCNGDGEVTIDELILGVRIALEMSDLSDCPEFDADGSEEVTVDELVQAVNNALSGCPET
jgi:hypothetical protein